MGQLTAMEYQPGVGLDARSAKNSGPLLHSGAFCVDKMAEQLCKCKGHSLGSLGEQILAGFTLLFLRGRLALQTSVVLAVYWRRICPRNGTGSCGGRYQLWRLRLASALLSDRNAWAD